MFCQYPVSAAIPQALPGGVCAWPYNLKRPVSEQFDTYPVLQEVIAISTNSKTRFYRALDKLADDPAVAKIKNYSQHKGTSTFRHCWNVAIYSFHLAEKLGWEIDEVALAKGAMLHDYYLYTVADKQKETNISDFRHGRTHPQLALENAKSEFYLTLKEQNMIRSHMWPLTLFHMPMSKEAWLISMADKYCAVREMYGDTKDLDPDVHTPWIRDLAHKKMRQVFEGV